jgi:hypothetical protein
MPQTGPVSENLLSDGTYDPAMYDLDFEKDPDKRGRWRVIRGLGNHIGYAHRVNGLWHAYDLDGNDLDPGLGWKYRWVAADRVSGNAPLTQDAERVDPDAFRVDRAEDASA